MPTALIGINAVSYTHLQVGNVELEDCVVRQGVLDHGIHRGEGRCRDGGIDQGGLFATVIHSGTHSPQRGHTVGVPQAGAVFGRQAGPVALQHVAGGAAAVNECRWNPGVVVEHLPRRRESACTVELQAGRVAFAGQQVWFGRRVRVCVGFVVLRGVEQSQTQQLSLIHI